MFGGLGTLDLDLFSRALRLRWLWYQWKEPDRPWVGSEAPVNELDLQLFRASTVVTIGNGLKAEFWNSTWLNVAPNFYKLAWRKHRKVQEEVNDHNRTRGLWRMSSITEISEFVTLWDLVQDVTFTDMPDDIIWRWTTDGTYSARSAYAIQFKGS